MKIDLTAAARIVLLNCADVGRARIAKHIRPADGGIAAGFAKGGDQRSANGKQALNQYVPKLQGLQNANYTSSAPPPLIHPLLAVEERVGATGPGGQCCGSGSLPRLQRDRWRPAGAVGDVTSPMTPPPVARSSSASWPRIAEDAVAILRSATIEEVRLAIGLPLGVRFLA